MADIEFDDFDDPGASTGAIGMGNLVNWAGALTSVTLVAGLTYWGYQLVMRDVTGVPVIAAIEGPMRVAPEDPGGRQAEHQGLAVNKVAADGEAEAPADRLVLAPRPVDLADEDRTSEEVARRATLDTETPAPALALSDPAETSPPQRGATPPVADTAATQRAGDDGAIRPPTDLSLGPAISAPEPVAPSLADTGAQGAKTVTVAPSTPAQSAPDSAPETAPLPATARDDVIPVTVPGVSRSARPVGRPAGDLMARAAAAAVANRNATPAPAPEELAATAVAAGTHLVQIGAFDSPEIARSEWTRVSGKFGNLFSGKSRVVQQTQSGSRTFYRLRATGFANLAATQSFCAALTAEGVDCIPVVAR